jgi:hypothetical protein
MKCWANAVSECSSRASGEHVFSKSLISSKVVSVSGYAWCGGGTKIVGLNALTKNCLCRNHNSGLSVLDREAKRFQDCVKKISDFMMSQSKFHGTEETYSINGLLLERWLLKVLINQLYGSDLFIGNAQNTAGIPGDWLVRICFGEDIWPLGFGLYSMIETGQQLRLGEHFSFMSIHSEATKIVSGCVISLGGFPLYLSIASNPFTADAMRFWGFGNDLDRYSLRYRQDVWNFVGPDKPARHISFKW